MLIEEFGAKPLSHNVMQLIGEFLEENKNRPVQDTETGRWSYTVPDGNKKNEHDRTLIKRTLDLYRGRFGRNDGQSVYNLIGVLKKTRQDISDVDLHMLNLSMCELNGLTLAHDGLCCDFSGALINNNTFFPTGHRGPVYSIDFNADGTRMITASFDRTAKIWDTRTYTLIHTLDEHSDSVNIAMFSPDNQHIITASDDDIIRVWDANNFSIKKTIKLYPDEYYKEAVPQEYTWMTCTTIINIDFETIGKMRVVLSGEKEKFYDLSTFDLCGTTINSLTYTSKPLNFLEERIVSFSPDGKRTAICSKEHTVVILDNDTHQIVAQLTGHTEDVCCVCYSIDGRIIVTGSMDTSIKVWDSKTYLLIETLSGVTSELDLAQYSPNSMYYAIASRDQTVTVWDTKTNHIVSKIDEQPEEIRSMAFSPDGKKLAVGTLNPIVHVYDTATGTELGKLVGHKEGVFAIHFITNEDLLITGSADNTAKIWRDYNSVIDLPHTDLVSAISYLPDSGIMATSSWDGNVILLEVDHEHISFRKFISCPTSGAFSAILCADGNTLFSTSIDNSIMLVDIETEHTLPIINEENNPSKLISADISKDKKRIVTAVGNNKIRVWDISKSLSSNISNIAYKDDFFKKALYIISNIINIGKRIFCQKTHSLIKTIECNDDVSSIMYSPDGESAITTSYDGKVQIWTTGDYECKATVHIIPRLFVLGCDMRNLHPDSNISDNDKAILRQYGAKID